MSDAMRPRVRGRLAQGLRRLGRRPTHAPLPGPGTVDEETKVRTRLIEEVRRQIRDGDAEGAAARAAELKRDPEHAVTGTACAGLVALSRGYDALAHHELSSLPTEVWRRHVASAYVRAGLLMDPDVTLREVRALLADDPASMKPGHWLGLVEPVFGAGELGLARELMDRADREIAARGAKPKVLLRHAWLHRWVDRSETSPTAPATQPVRFAVLDYDHPQWSKASANIGDPVQSIASLGHVVRRPDVSFEGPDDLRGLLERLQARVRPELRRDGDPVRVQVLTADRDATRYNAIPPDTWTLAFGWYMHELFGSRFGFPFHPNLQPLFVSFHCNKREMLTPEAIAYLRDHGPIGCRDWTTVDILLSLDVPAFFSGCLTSTINTVFEDLAEPASPDAPVAYVDVPAADLPEGATTYKHSSTDVRSRTFVENVDDAVQRLETYRRAHSAVVTSRLHCYLPMRSLGVPVDFVPENLSDIRFAGLAGISDEQFDTMRRGINDKLEQVLDQVLAGERPEEVYALWRKLTAAEVEEARRRHEAPAVLDDTPAELGDVLAAAVAGTRTAGPPQRLDASRAPQVHVAVSVSEVDEALRVALTSLCRHTGRDVHVWLLQRGKHPLDLVDLAAACGATISEVPVRELAELLRDRCEAKDSRMWCEHLFLGDLLPDVGRVVVIPPHALVRGDIGALADLDLGGHPFGAPDSVGSRAGSGFGVVHGAATRLRERTGLSTELRRQAHGLHVFDFSAFDAGVLVLDLDRLREERLGEHAARLVVSFGLTTRETLHVLAGPHRAVVPEDWYVVPTREHVDDPLLLHWRDRTKPWTDGVTPLQELWLEEAEAEAVPSPVGP